MRRLPGCHGNRDNFVCRMWFRRQERRWKRAYLGAGGNCPISHVAHLGGAAPAAKWASEL